MLEAPSASKDKRSRLGAYAMWVEMQGKAWYQPDLAEYLKHLLGERNLSASSASAHLSTIRTRYRELLRNPFIRDGLFEMVQPHSDSPADAKAFVDEIVERMRMAIDPESVKVEKTVLQDEADSDHVRLTENQARYMLHAPGIDTLKGLRDTAMIALMLCTGAREGEVAALTTEDLYQRYDGKLALRIRHGKGDKQRMIPYGELEWVLAIVGMWLASAGIDEGPVFRGFYRGSKSVRPTGITTRGMQKMMQDYPLMIDGVMRVIQLHNLRRTYARRLYDAGTDIFAISQNLGHSSIKTTERYVGALDGEKRQPPAIYQRGAI